MGGNKPASLTDAEWKVMRIVWELKSCAARDVYNIAGEVHDWAPTTVKKHLSNLVAKGFLSTTRVGNSFLYKPKRPVLQTLKHAADALLEKTLKGTDGPLLAYMLKKSNLTAKEIAELRELLDTAEPTESEDE